MFREIFRSLHLSRCCYTDNFMKHVATLALVLWTTIGFRAGSAQTLDVDWKVYGWASVGGDSACFYDTNSVVQRSDGHIRVWTKCLLLKDMDSLDIKKAFNGKILENAARKVSQYYVPPIAVVDQTIDLDRSIVITQYEETANIADVKPVARIFYELDCPERMMRELSIDLGKRGSANKPSDWKYIPPEGNGAVLLKILCPVR
jgi:hypothetical protein